MTLIRAHVQGSSVRPAGQRAAGTDRRGFRADVQGLRAGAVGLVLLYHAGVPPFSGGYVGVDVFFVISGFLISSHLLTSIERDGRVGFAQFYARRARRILPASFVVVAATVLALVLVAPPLALGGLLQDAVMTILYVPNIWFAAQDTDYLADHAASPFQHYWSLGVEEQFYLLWPLLLLGIAVASRRRRRPITYCIAAVAALSFLGCVLITRSNQPLAFFLLPTRAWELLAGALVAAAVLGRPARLPSWLAAAGGWFGVAAVVAAGVSFDDRTAFPGAAAALPVLGTAAVIYCGSVRRPLGPTRMLSARPLQVIGLISYSLYLVHWPLLMVPTVALGNGASLPGWARVLLGIVLAVPAAALLYRCVEQPLRAPPVLTARPPRLTLLATLAVTAVLALTVGAAVPWANGRTISSATSAPAAPATPAAPPVATTFVPANLTPSLQDVSRDVPDVYDRPGCHHDTRTTGVQDCRFGDPDGSFRVALFGDSHVAQWLPAFERISDETGDMSIGTYTKSSCPAVEVTILVKNVPYTSCDRWRAAVLAQLAADPVDLVVLSSYAYHPLAGEPRGAERERAWAAGLSRTIDRLRSTGSRVLVVADTPRFDTAPPICLSANLRDVTPCRGNPATSLDPALTEAERVATEAADAAFADLTPYLCDVAACPPIIGNLLVYRDVNHLTATFARFLAPALERQVEAARSG